MATSVATPAALSHPPRQAAIASDNSKRRKADMAVLDGAGTAPATAATQVAGPAGQWPRAASAGQQAAQRRLQLPAFGVEIVAFVAPGRETRFDLAPEGSRMVGADQVAQFVHQHVFECRRSRQQQRQVERDGAIGRQRAPLRGHHLELHAPRRTRQRRQVARQPAADIGARLAFVEIAQRTPQPGITGARWNRERQAVAVALQPGETTFVPMQRQQRAAQRQRRGFAADERWRVGEHETIELRGQPLAMLGDEALARDRARAQRHGQARAALVHRQAQALGARVSRARDFDGAAVGELYVDDITLERARFRRQQAADQVWHRSIVGATSVASSIFLSCRKSSRLTSPLQKAQASALLSFSAGSSTLNRRLTSPAISAKRASSSARMSSRSVDSSWSTAPSSSLNLRMTRSSPSTNDTWSSSVSASRVTCLPASRCLAISSDISSCRWHFTTAPLSAASLSSHSSPSDRPSGSGSPAIHPVSTARGAISAFSGSAGKLPSAWRSSLATFSAFLREEVSTTQIPCSRSSSASVRLGRTNARGSSSCTRSSFRRLRARPPGLRPSFCSSSASFFCSRSLTTAPGSSLSSPPTVSQIASEMRCDSASPSRPNGEMKPRENSSSAPTGLSAQGPRRVSRSVKSSEVGKRNRVRLRKNIESPARAKGGSNWFHPLPFWERDRPRRGQGAGAAFDLRRAHATAAP